MVAMPWMDAFSAVMRPASRPVAMRADATARPHPEPDASCEPDARSERKARLDADGAPDDPSGVDLSGMVDGLERTVLYRLVVAPPDMRRIAYVSANVERLFGLSPAAVRADARRWYDLIEPDDVETVMREEAAAIAENRPLSVEARFNVPAGQRMFSITASPGDALPDGSTPWDGVVTDVTRLWRARQERERLIEIAEATADVVGTTDVMGRLTYLNEAGRRMFGMDHRDAAAAGRVLTFADALPERLQARYREKILPIVLKQGVWSGETSIVDARGRERVVSQVIVAHRGADGRATHLSTILRDLSEREALEKELRRLNLRSETLLGEVNHRLKNLFALLPAIVQLSARGRTDVNEVVAVVRERVTALARSHALTLDSLDGAAGIALDALVNAVLEPYGDRAGKFTVEGPPVDLAMQDGNGLGLMLHELATNAAKHGALAHPAGTVAIAWRLGRDEAGRDRLRLTWREAGLSGVVPPPRMGGFGTRLVDRLLEAQGGTVTRDWAETGLMLDVDIPFYPVERGAAAG